MLMPADMCVVSLQNIIHIVDDLLDRRKNRATNFPQALATLAKIDYATMLQPPAVALNYPTTMAMGSSSMAMTPSMAMGSSSMDMAPSMAMGSPMAAMETPRITFAG